MEYTRGEMTHFRVAARTLLHLGAELISSDAVAFYELIKNAFDAGSPHARIRVVVRCQRSNELLRRLEETRRANSSKKLMQETLNSVLTNARQSVNRSLPDADECVQALENAASIEEGINALRNANYIEISDAGHGMDLQDLQTAYLTIGTRARLLEKSQLARRDSNSKPSERPILGEKGVGRLSAMRLGMSLEVTSSRVDERHWNSLTIDWNQFSHSSDSNVEDIPVVLRHGESKEDATQHGTTLRIAALNDRWSIAKLEEIATSEAAKFIDPFSPDRGFKVWFRYNGDPVPIPRFDHRVLEHAHAVVEADFRSCGQDDEDNGPTLSGHIDYRMRNLEQDFALSGDHLLGVAGRPEIPAEEAALRSLGPFSLKFYWFNRQALKALEDVGLGDKEEARKIVNQWSGGLMLFRDGFRVIPYGSPEDDWLDLDKKALAAQGYKVNRKQIIGKVDITSQNNPALTDQTNREGLRNCEEKEILVALLKHVLEVRFRAYINQVDRRAKPRRTDDLKELRTRVLTERNQVQDAIRLLSSRHPEVKEDPDILPAIRESLEKITDAMKEFDRVATSLRDTESQVMHLAAQGMLVEILAHELWRATSHALATVAEMERNEGKARSPSVLRTLAAQLKTLQKRLQILDPTNTAARQTKVTFDLYKQLADILKGHEAQFERHNIDARLYIKPAGVERRFEVKMVPGMVVQVVENLLSNSVYWLRLRRRRDSKFMPSIRVELDTVERELRVRDNGPGIEPERREEIFAPFVTTKPAGEGKGLGLYISREIAKYHNAELFLSEDPSPDSVNLNTFVLKLP